MLGLREAIRYGARCESYIHHGEDEGEKSMKPTDTNISVDDEKWRDPLTGQYHFRNNWGRICVCGHPLGCHIAGGHECITCDEIEWANGDDCDCQRFRQKRGSGGKPVVIIEQPEYKRKK